MIQRQAVSGNHFHGEHISCYILLVSKVTYFEVGSMGMVKRFIPKFVPLFTVGMGRYEKYVDRDVASAKPYRIRDSAF